MIFYKWYNQHVTWHLIQNYFTYKAQYKQNTSAVEPHLRVNVNLNMKALISTPDEKTPLSHLSYSGRKRGWPHKRDFFEY